MTDREIVKRDLIPFLYREEELRTITDTEGTTWFVLADICRILNLGNPTAARRPLSDDKVSRARLTDQQPDVLLVTEGGMWRVVMRSYRPEAVAFQDWVADTVLPSIRKTGEYQTQARVHEVATKVAAIHRSVSRKISAAESVFEDPARRSDAWELLSRLRTDFETDLQSVVSPDVWKLAYREMDRKQTAARTGRPYVPLPGTPVLPPEDED